MKVVILGVMKTYQVCWYCPACGFLNTNKGYHEKDEKEFCCQECKGIHKVKWNYKIHKKEEV